MSFFPIISTGSFKINNLLPETKAYRTRVLDDGGTVVDINYVNQCYTKIAEVAVNYSWLSASFGVKKDASNKISKLYSLGGADFDLVQSTPSLQPTWKESGYNSLPAIAFSVDTKLRSSVATVLVQSNSIYCVGFTTKNSSYMYDALNSSTARNAMLRDGSNNLQVYAGASLNTFTAPATTKIYYTLYNGASSAVYINNALSVSGDAGTHDLQYLTMGHAYTDGTYSPDGDISELLLINNNQGNGAVFSNYLNERFNAY
jgi:hypothetical protein